MRSAPTASQAQRKAQGLEFTESYQKLFACTLGSTAESGNNRALSRSRRTARKGANPPRCGRIILTSGKRAGISACMSCNMQIVSSSGAPTGQVSLAASIKGDPGIAAHRVEEQRCLAAVQLGEKFAEGGIGDARSANRSA